MGNGRGYNPGRNLKDFDKNNDNERVRRTIEMIRILEEERLKIDQEYQTSHRLIKKLDKEIQNLNRDILYIKLKIAHRKLRKDKHKSKFKEIRIDPSWVIFIHVK